MVLQTSQPKMVRISEILANGDKQLKYSTFGKPNGKTVQLESYTVDEAFDHIGFGKFQIWIIMVFGVALLANTVGILLMTLLGPLLQCEWGLSYIQIAFTTTVLFFGFLVAGPFLGYLGDRFDRKTSLLYSYAVTLFFGALTGFASNYTWILILRFLTGFGLGGLPILFSYLPEFLPTKTRGKATILGGVFLSLGGIVVVLLAMIILPFCSWRVWLVFSSVPNVIVIILLWFAPTSPMFDASTGNLSKATQTLKQMATYNNTTMPKGVLIKQSKMDKAEGGHLQNLFVPTLRKTTILMWISWFLVIFNLYGTMLLGTEIISYGTECVTEGTAYKGLMELPCRLGCYGLQTDDLVAILITAASEIPALVIVAFVVDPLGRKNSMILISLLGSVSYLLLIICINRTYIIGLVSVNRALAVSNLLVMYLYTPEVYPTECRSMGSGCCSAVGRFGAMTTPFVAQVLLAYSPAIGISFYAVLNLLVAVIYCFLPYETTGKGMA